jgi:molecular chaperone DnaK
MVQEAEQHASEDAQRREAIQVRNDAESFMFQAEKTVSEYGDKIPDDVKADLDTKIQAVKDILENDRENIDRLKPAHEELMAALQKASSSMYEAAAAEGAPTDGGPGGFSENGAEAGTGAQADDESTVEGEFREVNSDKN